MLPATIRTNASGMAQNTCCAGDDFDYWIPLSFDDEGNVRSFEVRL
jgi:hypothetical protein